MKPIDPVVDAICHQIALEQAAEFETRTIYDPWPKRVRHAFRQCEMWQGDATGPKGQCQNTVTATAYWNGRQLRVCNFHKGVIKNHEKGNSRNRIPDSTDAASR